jgi:hypothetical protein
MLESSANIFLLSELHNATSDQRGGERNVEKKITAIPRGCDSARVEQVIVTRALKGAGTENDPCREVIQYWTLDGKLLCEKD